MSKSTPKKCSRDIFWPVQKPLFHAFCRKLLLQMTVEWWEIILKTDSGYEKHSSKSGQYVSKKNQSHTTRRNENIAGKGQKCRKVRLKKRFLA